MEDSVLQSPDLTLNADSTAFVNYQQDDENYITQLFADQLPAIKNGVFNIHLSKGHIVQPYWHTNVTEMVFVIHGKVITSVFNPFTEELLSYKLRPGQVSIFPKGWFHWIVARSDNTHFLAIFDQPTPDIVYGSDFLRGLPKEIAHRAYGLDPADYAKAVAPIRESVILGPPGANMPKPQQGTSGPDPQSGWPYWHYHD